MALLKPAWLSRLPLARILMLLQFVQFAIVGIAGLAAETATIYALRRAIGLYATGVLAYAVSATLTWWINRIWTFQASRPDTPRRQWALYALANTPGFLINRTVFFTLVALSGLCSANPALAAASGSLAGLFCNFTLSRKLVFDDGRVQRRKTGRQAGEAPHAGAAGGD